MREMARKTNRSARTQVDIQATLFAGVAKQDVRLHDLSMHGAGLIGSIPVEFGNEVRVRFRVPTHGTTVVVEALADVRHLEDRRKGGAIGLRFLRLSYEAQRALSVFLRGNDSQSWSAY